MATFLHLADVHLGGQFYAASDALLKRARAAQRAALRRAVACALREEVDAVLVAGDLYDDRHLDYGTEQFLTGQLARLDAAGIACFYAAGSADPGGARFRGAEIDWPASVHRFAEPPPETVTLEDADGQPLARIVGAGHSGPDADENLAADFPKAKKTKKALPHVGLLHASLAPATRKALRKAGYDYWALGGAHRRQHADEEAHAWYAGPLLGCHPAEHGPQGGLLVTVEAGQPPQVEFQPFAPLCWADVRLDDLAGVETRHTLLQRAQQAFEAKRAEEEPGAWLTRFTLAGGCPLAPELHEEGAGERLEAALAEHLDLEAAFLRRHHLTLPADPARHRGEPHVLSEALDLIDRAEDDPALLKALAPGVLAAGSEETEAYLRERMEALDREACVRLLRKPPSE